jgi:ribosomal protein S18 acetylase RimI-like enzyme
MHNILLQKDIWLSKVLEIDSYKLEGNPLDLNKEMLYNLDFVYAKMPIEESNLLNHLTLLGFDLVETLVTFECKSFKSKRIYNSVCRFANSEDEKNINKIAYNSFDKSRFHIDPKIPLKKANLIKSEWVRSFFRGLRGDWMVVAEISGKICGFLQLIKSSSNSIIIDLIAVKDEYRGMGVGDSMIAFAFKNCIEKPLIQAGTQLINLDSIKFYETLGFEKKTSNYSLHFHKKL